MKRIKLESSLEDSGKSTRIARETGLADRVYLICLILAMRLSAGCCDTPGRPAGPPPLW